MGRTLKVLADLVDARAYRSTLATKERLSAGLERLTFVSEEFHDASADPGDATALRVSAKDFRHYTPALLDTETGELSIVVQRHGSGPGETLIDSWTGGEQVRICQWASVRSFTWPTDDAPVVVIGDGTVISLAMSMAERSGREGRDLTIVLEVDRPEVEATCALLPGAHVIAADGPPGAGTDAWLVELGHTLIASDDALFFLAGHGQSIQGQRARLRDELGAHRRRIRTQPFWATGKVGL